MKASKIASIIEKRAPLNLAEKYDNSGFQIGSQSKEINKVLTVLDITPEIIEEALNNNIDMIVSHHPFFFHAIKNIDLNTTKGKMIEDIIKNDLVIYTAHTNLDKSKEGINVFLGKLLGLDDIKPLSPDNTNFGYYKLVIYSPYGTEEKIKEVLSKEGAGNTGSLYEDVSFSSTGIGAYRPLDHANPYKGKVNDLNRVPEYKLETIIPKTKVNHILKEVSKVHPYEEMAYDLFPTELRELSSDEGLGIVGKYKAPKSVDYFIETLKEIFSDTTIRVAGPRPTEIKKVAICTGSGADLIRQAKKKKADVFITGDLKHHDAQLAEELHLWVLDVGHYGTEKFTKQLLKDIIEKNLPAGAEVEVIETKKDKDFISIL